jgi:hypothetical protein
MSFHRRPFADHFVTSPLLFVWFRCAKDEGNRAVVFGIWVWICTNSEIEGWWCSVGEERTGISNIAETCAFSSRIRSFLREAGGFSRSGCVVRSE